MLPVTADAKRAMRIFLVDDDHALRDRVARTLRLDGYTVTLGGSGLEALATLKSRTFDIVLADLFVSHLDAFELLQAALATNPETLVVMMSPYATGESSVEVLRQGAWDYLLKPFSSAELTLLVERATMAVWSQRHDGPADPAGENARRRHPISAPPSSMTHLDSGPPAAPAESSDRAATGVRRYHEAREEVIARFESAYVTTLLLRAGGNLSEAARIANIDRTTLYRLMERHGLHRRPRPGDALGARRLKMAQIEPLS